MEPDFSPSNALPKMCRCYWKGYGQQSILSGAQGSISVNDMSLCGGRKINLECPVRRSVLSTALCQEGTRRGTGPTAQSTCVPTAEPNTWRGSCGTCGRERFRSEARNGDRRVKGTRNRAGEKAKQRGDGGKNSLKGCRKERTHFILFSLYPPRVPGWGLHIRQDRLTRGTQQECISMCIHMHRGAPVGSNSRGG